MAQLHPHAFPSQHATSMLAHSMLTVCVWMQSRQCFSIHTRMDMALSAKCRSSGLPASQLHSDFSMLAKFADPEGAPRSGSGGRLPGTARGRRGWHLVFIQQLILLFLIVLQQREQLFALRVSSALILLGSVMTTAPAYVCMLVTNRSLVHLPRALGDAACSNLQTFLHVAIWKYRAHFSAWTLMLM